MIYKILFHPEAQDDYLGLDSGVQQRVAKQLNKIANSPELGQKLGNIQGIDLAGCRKMYAEKKQIRIVYEIIDDELFVHIVAIGKRDDMKVYKSAAKRKQ
jgi:mRNA interferase RelE/StbE